MKTRTVDEFDDLRHACAGLDGLALLRAVLDRRPFAGKTALVSSFGAESVVLLDMMATVDRHAPILFLDTGKLFPETEVYRKKVTELLELTDVRVVRPAPHLLMRRDPNGQLWREDPDQCCKIRKIEPLHEALDGCAAWITGRKRFQGHLRSRLATIEFDGSAGRIKLNPLAPWSEDDVERYRTLRNLPVHPLVHHNYRSIGCIPCTRAVMPGEPPRAGRWCGRDKNECGIHRRPNE